MHRLQLQLLKAANAHAQLAMETGMLADQVRGTGGCAGVRSQLSVVKSW